MDAVEHLRREVFPAEVLLPDGTYLPKARAFVTDRRLVVWTERPGKGIVESEFSLVDDTVEASHHTLPIHQRLEVPLQEGIAFVNRGPGCGCGSILKVPRTPYSF